MAENVSRPPNWAVDTPIGIQTASSSSHHGNKTTNSTTSTTITTQQQHHHQMVQYQNQIPPQPPPPPQHQQINQVLRPDTVVLRRQDGHGFGFTLRHFIVYPPDSSSESQNAANSGALALIQPMDTVFVKEVRPYGPAHLAGLNTGDRLLAVNGMPVAGTPYARVVAAIQQTPATLTLQVVPKECDILQTFFSETAHNPETNQRPRLYSPPTNAAIPTVAAAIPHESQHHNQKHQKAQQTKVAATGQNEILAQHHQNIIESQQRLLSAGGRNADGMQEGTAGITTVEMHCNNNVNQSRDQHESDVVNGMYSRPKAEPQVAMKSRRRGGGDEIIQVHHTVGSNMGNGQVRLHPKHHHHHNHSQQQQQQQQTNLSRPDNRSILVYDTHFSHLNPDAYDRRESSSSVASSLGSYDSGSTLTSDLGDSAIMTRLRKSFEQKEEFLRRPSQPIGYISETPPTTPAAVEQTSVKQREFYGRPQRLQKSIWPPIEQQPPYHPNRNQENIIESEYETISSPPPGRRPDNYMQAPSLERDFNKQQHQQRLQSPPMPLQVKSTNIPNSAIKIANHIAREQFYNGQNPQQMLMLSNDKQQQQQHQQQMDEFNSMETEDNCRFIPNAGLHIVSERTKQFESGRPLSPDGQLIDRTSLYRSELSRLSTKRPVPNVAVRRREFELIAENSDWRKISSGVQRVPIIRILDAREELLLDCVNDGKLLNVIMEEEEARKDDNDQSSSFDSISEGSIRHPAVRARSLSADSTRNEQSLRSDRSQVHSLTDDQLSREFSRKQPCRQNSYIEAVRHNTTSGVNYSSPAKDHHKQQQQSMENIEQLYSHPQQQQQQNDVVITRQHHNGSQQQQQIKLSNRNQTILTGVRLTSDPNVLIDFSEINALKKFSEPMEIVAYCKDDEVIKTEIRSDHHQDVEMRMIDASLLKTTGRNGQAVRPTTLNLSETTQVVRRQRTLTEDEDDERPMRRVSYLRATANETALQTESDMDQSPMSMPPGTPDTDEQAAAQALRSAHRPWQRPRLTTDIQPLRRIFEESPPPVHVPPISEPPSPSSSSGASVVVGKGLSGSSTSSKLKALSYLRDSPADPSLPVLRDGELNVKVTFIDGKRSQDRSWKTVWAEIRGNKLKLTIHREGKSSQSPEPSGIIDLRSFHVTEGNYTKRKHVFKLTSAIVPPQSPNSGGLTTGGRGDISSSPTGNGTEILIQTDSQQDMKLWMENLRSACGNDAVRSQDYINSIGTQNAEPQRIAGTTIIQTDDAISPVSPTKPARKITLGTRSPSGQSPVTKSRKTPQQTNVFSTEKRDQKDYSIKGLVVRGLRKIQGNSESPHQIDQPPEGASIGVSVQQCPMSEENEHVPFIVTRCTKIVESRGMGVIGIYRIPGNTAAITALAELVNRGFDDNCMNDPKWDDVNVVSSLLKLFIRKLPDGLLPNEMYQHFIDSDKLFGIERLKEIKKLLEKLPPYSYETLKHLMRHLNRVSNNCVINLMEPRNLAIVFGPSVVRTSSETLESAVKDMKHQCRIVEAFVLHYLFFFENESLPQLTDACEASINLVPEAQNTNLLLDNVAKIEQKETNFVTHIVQAANRKIRRNTYRKSTTSATPDTLSLDSNTSAESKEPMKRFGSDDSASIRRRGSTTDDVIKSEDDLSALDERSMSLNTVTLELDNKLRTLRSTGTPTKTATNPTNTNCNSPSASEKPLATNKPLCLGENIPYADESPERPIIPMRSKPMRILPRNDLLQTPTPPNSPAEFLLSPSAIRSSTTGHTMRSQDMDKLSPPSPQTPSGASSDETDASTTSNPRDNPPLPALPPPTSSSSRRINTDVLREILTELENKDKVKSMKTKLNRSLSLNYKNHRDECCCNNSRGVASSSSSTTAVHNRFSLTKDEKTDKNISKKRQLQDMRNYRRHTASGNRSIKRRHTVGGTHDYSRKNGGSGGGGNGNANSAVDGATCQGYVSTDLSSPDWMSRKKEMKASHLQDQENCRY